MLNYFCGIIDYIVKYFVYFLIKKYLTAVDLLIYNAGGWFFAYLLLKKQEGVSMNKSENIKNIKNDIHINKVVNQNIKEVGDGDIKTQNDKLNSLLNEHYANYSADDRFLIVAHLDFEKAKRGEHGFKYEFRDCKNELEELIKKHWEDIICNVSSETEDKFNRYYFTSGEKSDIPEGMCALKPEYAAYRDFKNKKTHDDYKFIDNEDNIYIADRVDLNENEQDEDVDERRPLYHDIKNTKANIAIGIRREKVGYLRELRENGNDKEYVLYPETLVSFLKTLYRNSIDCPEKRKIFLKFLQSKKLKIQDFNSEVMCEVIDLVKFGRYTNINEWFDFLGLNKKRDLSPSVLLKCACKASKWGNLLGEMYYYPDEYIEQLNKFGTEYISSSLSEPRKKAWIKDYDLELDNDNVYRPKVSNKYCYGSYYRMLNGKFSMWKPDDIKETLSFVRNYKWPEANSKDYNQEVDCFFGLLVCLLDNLTPGKKIAIASVKWIFDFVNKNMPSVKLPIDKIKEYENGRKLLQVFKKYFVKIDTLQKNQDDIEFKIDIDYYGMFNDFVKTRFDDDENIKYNSLDELSKGRENLIAEFVEYGKKIEIDVSEDVAKTLFLSARSIFRILGFNRTKRNIVNTPEDFKRYIVIINTMKSNGEVFSPKKLCYISNPIANEAVPADNMFEFLQEHVKKKYDMSFSTLHNYVYSKIKQNTKWTYENIIKLLSYSKDFSEKDKDFDYDLKNYFLYLLSYIFKNTDENVDMDFWESVFNWINENMPVYFSDELLEDYGNSLKSVLRWHGINLYASCGKLTVKHDYSYVQEQLDFFVWGYFCTKAESKGDTELKTEKFKSLSDIKSECDLLMDQFLKEYSKKITAICVKNELKSKLKVRLYDAYAMQNFIKSIEPGIIKSSDDLRDFIDHVNRINLNKVSAFTGDVGYAADFVSDNSLSIDEVESLLSCLARRGELYPDVLYKYCRKIKKDTKWKFGQIRNFVKYLEGCFELTEWWSDKVLQSESLFGILNYLVSNYIVSKDDKTLEHKAYISCIFYLLQDKLYRIDFADLLSKADDFENGKELKQTLESVSIKIDEIDLSEDANDKVLNQILNTEGAIEEKAKKGNITQTKEIVNHNKKMDPDKLNQEAEVKERAKNKAANNQKNNLSDVDNEIKNGKEGNLNGQNKNGIIGDSDNIKHVEQKLEENIIIKSIRNGNESVVSKDKINNIGKGKEENGEQKLEIQQEKDQSNEFNKVQTDSINDSINGTENLKVNTDKSKNENSNEVAQQQIERQKEQGRRKYRPSYDDNNNNNKIDNNLNLMETKNYETNSNDRNIFGLNGNIINITNQNNQTPQNSNLETKNSSNNQMKKEENGNTVVVDKSGKENSKKDTSNKNKIKLKIEKIEECKDEEGKESDGVETNGNPSEQNNNFVDNSNLGRQNSDNNSDQTERSNQKRENNGKGNKEKKKENQIVKQLARASKDFAEFCAELDKEGIVLNKLDLNKLEFNYIKPGFLDNVLAFFQTIFDTVFNRVELKHGFWEHARRRACYWHIINNIINNKCVNVAEALKNKLNNSNKDKLLGSRQEKNQSIRIIPSSEPRKNQIEQ